VFDEPMMSDDTEIMTQDLHGNFMKAKFNIISRTRGGG